MPVVHVAVGVIRNEHGEILIARRHDGAHQGGLWEFPGGKVETGESVCDALRRELSEELGLRIGHCKPLIAVEHDYGDKQVCLDVWSVEEFEGRARGLEGQPLAWVAPEQLQEYAFPAANLPIIRELVSRVSP